MLDIQIPIPPLNTIIGMDIYRQYRFDDVMSRIFQEIKTFYYQMYLDIMKERLSEQNWGNNTTCDYIAYYYKALYGFRRPYGRAMIVNKWDEGKKWNSGIRWDDTKSDGYMPISLYRKLVKHLFSYENNSFSLDWLWCFVSDFCNTTNFTFTFDSKGVTINIKETKESSMLSDVFATSLYNESLPLTPIKFNLTKGEK